MTKYDKVRISFTSMSYQSSYHSVFPALISPALTASASPLRSLKDRNNSLDTAKSIGTLPASSSTATINFRGKLGRNDRVDFFRLDVAPGASFSTQADNVNVKGGRIRITTYFQLPGQPLTKFRTKVYRSGASQEEFPSPFSNNFGITLQVYSEVRNLTPKKTVTYRSQSLFS